MDAHDHVLSKDCPCNPTVITVPGKNKNKKGKK